MLYTIISRFVFSCFYVLLSNTKAFEDGMEDFVGGDGAAGDFCKVEKHGAEVLADEVAGQAVAQAGRNAVEVGKGGEDGGIMALVGDDDVVLRGGGSLRRCFFQIGNDGGARRRGLRGDKKMLGRNVGKGRKHGCSGLRDVCAVRDSRACQVVQTD